MLQRALPAGFVAACLPTKTDKLPSGSQWLHEIKHPRRTMTLRRTNCSAGAACPRRETRAHPTGAIIAP